MKFVTINDLEPSKAHHNPNIRKHIILTSGELGSIVSFAKAVFPPGEISTAHSHINMGEVFLVQSGEGIIRINNVEFKLRQGVCAVVEPNEVHEIENTCENNLEIIYFEIMAHAKKS
jgi:mannose-6-phosphate isomerase-like protein (cupin superfamily)